MASGASGIRLWRRARSPPCARSSVPEESAQKLFRQIFFVGNVANSDRTLGVAPGQQHHRLQRIQPFLGNLHSVPAPDYPYVRDRHYRKCKRTTKALNFMALAGPVISASYRWKKDFEEGRLCKALHFREGRHGVMDADFRIGAASAQAQNLYR